MLKMRVKELQAEHSIPVIEAGTGQKIRQLALKLFADKGFHSISLRQLAASLNMHPGSLYNHIESKQGLLYDLIEEHESDLLEHLVSEQATSGSIRSRLERFVHLHLQFNCLHDRRHELARSELRSLGVQQRETIEQLRVAQRRVLEKILENCALSPNERRPLAEGLDALLNGLVAGYAYEQRPSVEDLARLFTGLLLNGWVDSLSVEIGHEFSLGGRTHLVARR